MYYQKQNHIHFKMNNCGSDYIVGDIHGKFEYLMKCLSESHFDTSTDRLFCVGDLIDRGEGSDEVIELLESDWFFSVMGNHEEMLIESTCVDGLLRMDHSLWFDNGGTWWKYMIYPNQKENLRTMIDELPVLITIDTPNGVVGLIHADVPELSLDDLIHSVNRNHTLPHLWSRTAIRKIADGKHVDDVEGLYKLIHGHTIVHRPVAYGNRLYIDTGAFMTKELDDHQGHYTFAKIENDSFKVIEFPPES